MTGATEARTSGSDESRAQPVKASASIAAIAAVSRCVRVGTRMFRFMAFSMRPHRAADVPSQEPRELARVRRASWLLAHTNVAGWVKVREVPPPATRLASWE